MVLKKWGYRKSRNGGSRGSRVKEKVGLGETGWLKTECKVVLVLDKGMQGGSCAR